MYIFVSKKHFFEQDILQYFSNKKSLGDEKHVSNRHHPHAYVWLWKGRCDPNDMKVYDVSSLGLGRDNNLTLEELGKLFFFS